MAEDSDNIKAIKAKHATEGAILSEIQMLAAISHVGCECWPLNRKRMKQLIDLIVSDESMP